MEANTPQLWDRVWDKPPTDAEHRCNLAREANTIRWRRIRARVEARWSALERLRVIEIGAGTGTNAGLMARCGARVTVLDYSERALARAREFFRANGLRGEFVHADALALPPELGAQFDVSMSFGLAEHFTGASRLEIFRSHLAVVRPGGMALVSVPNAYNLPYRAFKWVAETTRRWKLGVEVPFTRRELEAICAQLGVTEYEFFGDSLITSLQFVNPLRYLRKRLVPPRVPEPTRLRPERGTRWDARWSYATVLVMHQRQE